MGKTWMDSIASPLGNTLLKEYAINHLLVDTRGDGWDWQGGIDYGQFLGIPHRSDHSISFGGSYQYDNAESNSFDHYRLDYVKKGEMDYRNRFDKVKNSGYQSFRSDRRKLGYCQRFVTNFSLRDKL